MNLAHETDLLLLEEITVIDETGAQFCVVFPLLIIEGFDAVAWVIGACASRGARNLRSRLFFRGPKTPPENRGLTALGE
jgi:hypothetical protein